jgi:hypothetical protein
MTGQAMSRNSAEDRVCDMGRKAEAQETEIIAGWSLDEKISFVLNHPGMSAWLKHALREALPRDPVSVLNDLEILNLILRERSQTAQRAGCITRKAG